MNDKRFGVARRISKAGFCSRRMAERLVEAGRVRVNGEVVRNPEWPCASGDCIVVDGAPLREAPKIYLALNKPRGLVTSVQDEQGRDTVYKCLESLNLPHVAPVGRLDKASEGLLLFTNDSVWAERVLNPETHCPKVYHVQIYPRATADFLERMRQGVLSDGEWLCAERVDILRAGEKNGWVSVELIQGKNRQIRRMCHQLGYTVLRLVRVRIGPVVLGDLPKGAARFLNQSEIDALGKLKKDLQD